MLRILVKYGDLSPDYFYHARRALDTILRARATRLAPFRSSRYACAVDANLWDGVLFEEMFDMQATMFQRWGMDRIPAAFHKRLADIIHFDSRGGTDRKTPKGVASSIATQDRLAASVRPSSICTIPLSILRTDADFSPDFRQAINRHYDSAYKIAWSQGASGSGTTTYMEVFPFLNRL